MHGASAAAGIGESTYYERGQSPYTEFQLACTAIQRAVADAGLALSDIDGFVTYSDQRNSPVRLARALGVRALRWNGTPWGGGNSMAAAVQSADAAVSAGYARHVVVFRALAQGQFGRFGQVAGAGAYMGGPFAFNGTYGVLSPAQQCALHTARFMHDHGISQEALCEIALACYANAQRNPRALRFGKPLTRAAYHASRWIVTPFHLYDCCPENDGAAAVVVTTAERARDLRHRPVPIVAAVQGIGPTFGTFTGATLGSSFYGQVGRHLWEATGLQPKDVDVAQFYENFTGPVLMALCEMGFAPPDGIEAFVCIPSKALLDSSEHFSTVRHGLDVHGITVGSVALDLGAMMSRKDRVVKGLTQGIASLFKKNKVERIAGSGRFVAADTVEVVNGDTRQTLRAVTSSSPPAVSQSGFRGCRSTASVSSAPVKRCASQPCRSGCWSWEPVPSASSWARSGTVWARASWWSSSWTALCRRWTARSDLLTSSQKNQEKIDWPGFSTDPKNHIRR